MLYPILRQALAAALIAAPTAAPRAGDGDQLFREVVERVRSGFYDAAFVRDSLPSLEREFSDGFRQGIAVDSAETLARAFLSRLHASHTYLLTPREPEYYQLAAVFAPFSAPVGELFGGSVRYPSIGIVTVADSGRTFVLSVLPGSPAERAGILSGDEIVAADGRPFRPVESLRVPADSSVALGIRRIRGGVTESVSVRPRRVDPAEEALAAQKASVRVERIRGKSVAYVHVYSYAGSQYQDALVEAVAFGPAKDADALVVDLRFGMGGADPTYLNVFNRDIPVLESAGQDGVRRRYDPQWRKPAVLLVDRSSRSGKEIIAFGAKRRGLALVVGDTTAGAVLGGGLAPLSNGDLLYLAEQDSWVDGIRLEGRGVPPDVQVPWDFRYMRGDDPRVRRALELAADAAARLDSPATR